jgi:formate C-acetyltransferase
MKMMLSKISSQGFQSVVRKSFRAKQSVSSFALPKYTNVSQFIEDNVNSYNGDEKFLQGPTKRTTAVWSKIQELMKEEHRKGILDVDPSVPSTITSFGPGYIDKDLEIIVGLQTDKPLKRAIKPLGGVNMVKNALQAFGYAMDPEVEKVFTKVRKTHNSGVFDAYTEEMKKARKSGILTGLPDGYGRGRIIGDYRRVALYGVDYLIEQKKNDLKHHLIGTMTEETIRLREEVQEQIRALQELKSMALSYGFDISQPALNSKEAVQWLYFAYLAVVKQNDGAATSLPRIDAFLDIYFENDIKSGLLTEQEAQEIIDDFVIKLRIVRHLRTPEYDRLFSGDPTWVTTSLGGLTSDGNPLVTKTSYRILNTLYNLNPSPEPNITILWSKLLPEPFKKYCSQVSIDTSSIQYENDDVMRPRFSSDYSIACCVSAMNIGKDLQYFGARCNMPKLLLYCLNQGRDELTGAQVAPQWSPVKTNDGPLDFNDVMEKLDVGMDWLSELYCNTMNIIHFMHDKYNYESIQFALHDTDIRRLIAFGISGFSVLTDSLSAIKYAKVYPVYADNGIMIDFRIEGDFPRFGNDDDRVDDIGKQLVETFMQKLQKQQTYRNAIPTLSLLTITSNVVYGKATGNTPDGRKHLTPFPPGANPVSGCEINGALAGLNSVAKLPYDSCKDGISLTFSITPPTLGKTYDSKKNNLVKLLDGYFAQGAQHTNINVFHKDTFLDAMEHPEKYPNLTIRVSGYAVAWHKLTPELQREFISRTFHESM